MKRTVSRLMFALLSIGLLTLAFDSQPVRSEPQTIVVPDDYPTIQEAINNAGVGDTISVRNGMYNESVVVNKTVSLVGENMVSTIIVTEQKYGSGISIEVDNVTVCGFTINTGYFGIWVKSSNCLIANNTLVENGFEGVFLDGRIENVTKNVVKNNHMLNNYDTGILIWGGNDNYVGFNEMEKNYVGVFFHSFGTSTGGNIVECNEIIDNEDAGVVLNYHSSNNLVRRNNISNNGWLGGVPIFTSGIALNVQSNANEIVLNNITNNKRGVYQYLVSNNSIHHNLFINNSEQVFNRGSSENLWDNGYPSGGNYWDDYVGVDLHSGPYQNETGSDGVGDTPCVLDGSNQDRYPLMNPYVPLTGDLNKDGVVDIRDIAIAALAFGSFPGHPRWNVIADVNQDEKVDIKDIAIVASHFGE